MAVFNVHPMHIEYNKRGARDEISDDDHRINHRINHRIKPPLGEIENAVFEAIKADLTATMDSLALSLTRSASSVNNAIRALREKGYIVRKGSKKAGVWEIVD